MKFMCRNGHLHTKQFLAEDCQRCRRAETRKREKRSQSAINHHTEKP